MNIAKEMHELAEQHNVDERIETESVYLKFKQEILKEIDELVYRHADQGFFNLSLGEEQLFYEFGMKEECLPLLKNDLEEQGFKVKINGGPGSFVDNTTMFIGW